MQKAVVIKQTWEIILMIPHHLLEASGVPACIYIAERRLNYCAHEASPMRRNGLVNQVEFLELVHDFATL